MAHLRKAINKRARRIGRPRFELSFQIILDEIEAAAIGQTDLLQQNYIAVCRAPNAGRIRRWIQTRTWKLADVVEGVTLESCSYSFVSNLMGALLKTYDAEFRNTIEGLKHLDVTTDWHGKGREAESQCLIF